MIGSAVDLTVLKVIIAVLFIFFSCDSASGRKCVCTSKACKESGAKTCRTRFSCYTELIYSAEATVAAASGSTAIKTTRGCTEGATPLLCETKTWRGASDEQYGSNSNSLEQVGRAAWPRLTCCDDRDYCNAADEDFETTSAQPQDRQSSHESTSEFPTNRGHDYPPRSLLPNDNTRSQHVQTLHVAALVLAIAALISVFAACYVVTRFLNVSGASSGLPRILNPYASSGMSV
ncbi:uncharacterized protein LOC131669636 [Phymastichus coffea]|uniref:uncharacterized protein LOC131669636 n=1 Tax=Phymastichus coffea TaxID=108790 RepID=UPI00273BA68E|nr:uncharacterized protein LOC131669636 [Phymastichus coffea]